MSEPFHECQPSQGLHVLKDHWRQKAYLGTQSAALAQSGQLSAAIAATFEAAPVRHQGFRLDRTVAEVEDIDESEEERQLESAMMKRWGASGMWPVPRAWDRLVACQVPLFSEQSKRGWGYIDLLGMTGDGIPVVVELKKGVRSLSDGKTDTTETPLRMLLEAASYAVALRKNWNHFRTEWRARLGALGLSDEVIAQVPLTLETVPIVAAAPASFWLDWLPVTRKGQKVSVETWQSFKALLSEFEKEGLPVAFVSISGHCQNSGDLGVQPLVGFPLET